MINSTNQSCDPKTNMTWSDVITNIRIIYTTKIIYQPYFNHISIRYYWIPLVYKRSYSFKIGWLSHPGKHKMYNILNHGWYIFNNRSSVTDVLALEWNKMCDVSQYNQWPYHDNQMKSYSIISVNVNDRRSDSYLARISHNSRWVIFVIHTQQRSPVVLDQNDKQHSK